MVYRSMNLKSAGDTLVNADGELTLVGVTQPVSPAITSFKCPPHSLNKKGQCGADGLARLKRSEFEMASLGSAGDDIKILFQIEAYKD